MTACSALAAEAQEPLIGTAPVAQCWIVLEQPGPWGREALLDSHLDHDLGRAIVDATRGTGTRVILARHPDRTERRWDGARHVWIAHTAPGTVRMRRGRLEDPAVLRSWDFAAMAAGSLPPIGTTSTEPVMFVCTHSGRDACCALHGRQLVTDLLAEGRIGRDDLWECSHLGGHRFAPTALTLPGGAIHGRLSTAAAEAVMSDARNLLVELAHYRGRTCFPAPMQVAEAAVRAEGVIDRDVLDVLWVRGERAVPVGPGVDLTNIASMLAEVRHADGRAWRVEVREEPLGVARPESCGGEPVIGTAWRARSVTPTAPWTAA